MENKKNKKEKENMKKAFLAGLIALTFFALVGCDLFGPEDKEFTGSGITVTLNDSFYESENVSFPLYLISVKHIFAASRELKTSVSPYGIRSLSAYAEAVLENNNHGDSEVLLRDEDGHYYRYAYYTADVDGTEYGYMIVFMEGASHYYAMNFGCLNKNLEASKEQYFAWADTIVVE